MIIKSFNHLKYVIFRFIALIFFIFFLEKGFWVMGKLQCGNWGLE
jgi:hypothetical protein